MRLSASRSCRAAAARIADSPTPISHAATTSEGAATANFASGWRIYELSYYVQGRGFRAPTLFAANIIGLLIRQTTEA